METIGAKSKHVFTLLWEVENADLLDSERNIMRVSTPHFRICTLKKKIFLLELSVKKSRKPNKYLTLFLFLLDNSFGFLIDTEWSFLGSDGKPLFIGKKVNRYLKKNDWIKMSHLPMFEDVFQTRGSEFFHHKALTIRIRIWKSRGNLANNEYISCQSRLETVKYSFLWNIPEFSSLQLDKELIFPVTLEVHTESDNFRFGFSLVGVSLLEANAVMQFYSLLIPRAWNITVGVSILDNERKVVRFFERRPNFYKKQEIGRILLGVIPRKEILTNKLQFLRNDTLTLLCKVSVVQRSINIRKNCFNFLNLRELDFSKLKDSSSQTSEQSDDSTAITPQRDSSAFSSKSPSTFSDSISHTTEQAFNGKPTFFRGNESLRILAQDIINIYRNEILTDFELRSGNNTFRVHKNILSARSAFFREMFTSNSPDSGSNVINIPDLDTQTLCETLNFLYSGLLENLNLERVLKLHDAAEKYKVQSLKEECCNFLRSHISSTNFYEVL